MTVKPLKFKMGDRVKYLNEVNSSQTEEYIVTKIVIHISSIQLNKYQLTRELSEDPDSGYVDECYLAFAPKQMSLMDAIEIVVRVFEGGKCMSSERTRRALDRLKKELK